MPYLIAKDYNKPGCVAYKTQSGKHLAALVKELSPKLLNKNIQILTVSSPEVYGEYKPYTFVETEEEFIEKAERLAKPSIVDEFYGMASDVNMSLDDIREERLIVALDPDYTKVTPGEKARRELHDK